MSVNVTNGYITVADLARYLTIDATTYADDLASAINASSRQIDTYCARRFYADSSATARLYMSRDNNKVIIDDAYEISLVQVASADNAVYDITVPVGSYYTKPLNGYADGISGMPATLVYFTTTAVTLPTSADNPSVKITAKWGWAAVPEPVRQSTLLMAAETFKMREAPFGVAGFADFGAVRVGKMSPQAVAMLRPYRSGDSILGVG